MLSGEQARQIFEKSALPNEVLGRIWQLADTEQRGALVLTEFVIAMHLLTSMKTGALRALPTILPAALYEAATRRSIAAAGRPQSPTGPAPLSAIPRQLSGQAGHQMPMRTGSPLGPHIRSPLAPPPSNDGWLITPADKTRFDVIYETLDKGKKGFITGEEAVPFFGQSNLPEDALAQIWDLADIRSEGRLNRDEFAVAMYLIRQQRTKQGGLPSVLPPNLMPPTMRNQSRPPTSTNAFDAPPQHPPQVQQPPPPPKPASALDDLFGLDSMSAPPAPTQRAMVTGGSNQASDPFASSASPVAPSSPARMSPTPTGGFKPFVPSSSFGRTLTSHATGESNSSASAFQKPAPPPQPTVSEDLLGDGDTETNKFTTENDTMELANLSNQIGTLSKSMQDVQGQRNATQAELNTTNQQKKNFEQRLGQLRTLYETQAKDVRELQDKLNTSRNETKKLQTEMAMVQATYQDLQTQHQTIATALQADQQENAGLKERIRAVNAEVAALKPQIEKLKSEARQQKGLVAINKKQLATNEAEREKLKTESGDLTKENLELARQLSQSPTPSAVNPPPQVASPAPSTASANNPFFRRTGSTDMMGAFASPGASKTFNDKSFDDVFGPAISSSSPPPAASFKPQHTGASATSTGSFATPISATPTVSRQATFAGEAPPPPESKQINSNFLPFGDANESLTSSRQVSPPMSRVGPETPAAEAPAPIEPTATGQSVASGAISEARPLTSNGTGPESFFADGATAEPAAASSSTDPFAAMDQHKAKDDFDSAFASFKAAKAPGASADTSSSDAPKNFSTFHSEFPPISELEKDDDSDSEDGTGFDDDFAPASPNAKVTDQPGSPTLNKSVADSAAATGPTEPEKASAPGPTSPVAVNMSEAQADDIFGSAPPPGAFPEAEPVPQTTTTNTAPVAKQSSAFDDLDDEFADLEDAKEGSTADDDFQTISRSGLDDFNPVFDSSPPPSHSTAKSEHPIAPATSTGAPFGGENSFDFGSVSNTSASNLGASTTTAGGTTVGVGESAPKGSPNADNHDWDAIFASLDDAPPAATGSPPLTVQATPAVEPSSSKETASTLALPRPTTGSALTDDGEHDDPILKNLTSMGYARTDALGALEKYDYNLERVSSP